MKSLTEPDFKIKRDEPTTHGINITIWDLPILFSDNKKETVKTLFWDFGSQDIYHSTHQFFLTKRSLYILVWEARKEEDTKTFDYWLNVVKLLGSGSPIIIVMNKADIRTKIIDEASLKKKFPEIRAFLKVSCLTGQGLTELKELIQTTLGNMPHLQDNLPGSWLHIRDELKTMKENYIPASQFYEICKKHEIKKNDANVIADYLHDLGAILFFRHDPLLGNTVILKPQWATEAVYALIDAKPIIETKGKFQFKDLPLYWGDRLYPTDKHPQLVRLMERFELCFNFIDSNDYFIPELLPDPIAFDMEPYYSQGSIHFQYRYEFMPEGILS